MLCVGTHYYNPSPNLSETRFKKGFYRRSVNNIVNDMSNEHNCYSQNKAIKAAEQLEKKKELIRSRDYTHGMRHI